MSSCSPRVGKRRSERKLSFQRDGSLQFPSSIQSKISILLRHTARNAAVSLPPGVRPRVHRPSPERPEGPILNPVKSQPRSGEKNVLFSARNIKALFYLGILHEREWIWVRFHHNEQVSWEEIVTSNYLKLEADIWNATAGCNTACPELRKLLTAARLTRSPLKVTILKVPGTDGCSEYCVFGGGVACLSIQCSCEWEWGWQRNNSHDNCSFNFFQPAMDSTRNGALFPESVRKKEAGKTKEHLNWREIAFFRQSIPSWP